MTAIAVRELRRDEIAEAAHLLGRGMCDNPVNARAFAISDPERRCRALTRFFVPVVRRLHRRGSVVGAFREEAMVGVCCVAPPHACQPRVLEKLKVVPSVVLGNPLGTAGRVLRWVGEWSRRDPPDLHWHLGPLAVDPPFQGQGVGKAMMTSFCAQMDARGGLSYLETDKPENVRFYQKFGFSVLGEAEVLGVSNWFMSRPARSDAVDFGSRGS
jgi:ribosomal protein S18 acetylase RimI-like enzyme